MNHRFVSSMLVGERDIEALGCVTSSATVVIVIVIVVIALRRRSHDHP